MESLLRNLTEIHGPSGEESPVRALIRALIKDHVDRIFEDSMGNLYALRDGPDPKIMVSAHMDEIGIIVTGIDEHGFLRVAPVGGISPRFLIGQRIIFMNGVRGTVNHEKLKGLNELDWQKLYVDIGQNSKTTAEGLVNIGDLACLDQSFTALPGGRYISKAMDDRVGCAVMIKTIIDLPATVPQSICFLFSTQEELGLRGAKTAAFRFDPHYGLAVDVTMVGDTPEAEQMAVSLGCGPAVKIRDKSLICHPKVRELIIAVAKENDIPYQLEVLERGGTDVGAIHLSRQGVPSGAISIPCRYVHSPAEMTDHSDLSHGVTLLTKLLLKTWPKLED